MTSSVGVDEARAIAIARTLRGLLERGGPLVSMPEYVLPRGLEPGSREHALYLTYVIAVDYMVDAEKLWRRARELYERDPSLFTPERVLAMGEEELARALKQLGARFPRRAASDWKEISRILLERYGGDPRNIAREPLSVGEILRRLGEFPTLRGEKLSAFYVRVMHETGLFKVRDPENLGLPVNRQISRFTVYTGVLAGADHETVCSSPELRALVREVWRRAAAAAGVPAWKLDEPMWNIGSKLCAKDRCLECPVKELCARYQSGAGAKPSLG